VGRARHQPQAALVRAERDGGTGPHGGSGDGTGVRVDAAGNVDGHGAFGRREGRQPGLVRPQSAAATDAEQPVQNQVGSAEQAAQRLVVEFRGGAVQPATGSEQGGAALRVGAAGCDRVDPGASRGQACAGPQGVTAIVTGPGEHDDPGAVDAIEAAGDISDQAVHRALHEGTGRQAGEQPCLGIPDLSDRVRVPHAAMLPPAERPMPQEPQGRRGRRIADRRRARRGPAGGPPISSRRRPSRRLPRHRG
jgi:hypothetical protein